MGKGGNGDLLFSAYKVTVIKMNMFQRSAGQHHAIVNILCYGLKNLLRGQISC